MSESINKQKLDELLGIGPGQTLDDILNEDGDLDTERIFDSEGNLTVNPLTAAEAIKQSGDRAIQKIESKISALANCPRTDDYEGNLVALGQSYDELKDLCSTCKSIITHLYTTITSADILDGEAINGMANLMTECRQLIGEYSAYYRSRVSFYDKMLMEDKKQKDRIELLKLRHEMEMEKLDRTHPAITVDGTGQVGDASQVNFSPDELINALNDISTDNMLNTVH